MVATKFSVFVMQFLRCFSVISVEEKEKQRQRRNNEETVNEFGAKISVKSENKK